MVTYRDLIRDMLVLAFRAERLADSGEVFPPPVSVAENMFAAASMSARDVVDPDELLTLAVEAFDRVARESDTVA